MTGPSRRAPRGPGRLDLSPSGTGPSPRRRSRLRRLVPWPGDRRRPSRPAAAGACPRPPPHPRHRTLRQQLGRLLQRVPAPPAVEHPDPEAVTQERPARSAPAHQLRCPARRHPAGRSPRRGRSRGPPAAARPGAARGEPGPAAHPSRANRAGTRSSPRPAHPHGRPGSTRSASADERACPDPAAEPQQLASPDWRIRRAHDDDTRGPRSGRAPRAPRGCAPPCPWRAATAIEERGLAARSMGPPRGASIARRAGAQVSRDRPTSCDPATSWAARRMTVPVRGGSISSSDPAAPCTVPPSMPPSDDDAGALGRAVAIRAGSRAGAHPSSPALVATTNDSPSPVRSIANALPVRGQHPQLAVAQRPMRAAQPDQVPHERAQLRRPSGPGPTGTHRGCSGSWWPSMPTSSP